MDVREIMYARGADGREASEADWLAGEAFVFLDGTRIQFHDRDTLYDMGVEVITFISDKNGDFVYYLSPILTQEQAFNERYFMD